MKKSIFLSTIFFVIMLLTINVKAVYISSSEVDNNSYVIGKYLFTRDKNTEKNYNGELTTQVMLLASKSIDGEELTDMQVYYKTFLGDWINGITGESITPPNYFEIENRNLRELISQPEMDCWFENSYRSTDSEGKKWTRGHISCMTSALIDNNLNYASTYTPYNNLQNIDGVEFYVLKNSDGTLPTTNAMYNGMIGFRANNKDLIPVKLNEECDDNGLLCNGDGFYYGWYQDTDEPLYQIVSRLYYLDGDKKIYSEYSNIQSNGARAKFGLDMYDIKLSPTLNEEYKVKVDSSVGYFGPGINGEVNYYNVKFNLSNVDTTKYMIREYRVFSRIRAYNNQISDNNSYLSNAEGGNDTFEYFYREGLFNKKYTNSRAWMGNTSPTIMYLIAEAKGYDVFGEYHDMSSTAAISKRLYFPGDVDDQLSRVVEARLTICNLDQTECYDWRSNTAPDNSEPYVR